MPICQAPPFIDSSVVRQPLIRLPEQLVTQKGWLGGVPLKRKPIRPLPREASRRQSLRAGQPLACRRLTDAAPQTKPPNPVTFRPDLTVAAARVAFPDPAEQKDFVVHSTARYQEDGYPRLDQFDLGSRANEDEIFEIRFLRLGGVS